MRLIFALWLSVAFAQAQVGFDPSFISGWSRTIPYGQYVLSPYDIILDALNVQTLPKHFRSPTFVKPSLKQKVDITGFNTLRISGSGQFSRAQFLELLSHMKKRHHVMPKDLYLVDLREEPHFLVNDDAVTVHYGPLTHQKGKSPEEVINSELIRIRQVKAFPYFFMNQVIKFKDGMPGSKATKILALHSVESEKHFVESQGAHYLRIPVTDHYRPENKDIDAFLDFVNSVPASAWLHLKCRGGKGRTTTFMVLYDMIKNPHVKKSDFLLIKLKSLIY